jgi:hypothetical protein
MHSQPASPLKSMGKFGTKAMRAMGIRDRPTAARSPWQNGYCERAIGSIRRDCLDHLIVVCWPSVGPNRNGPVLQSDRWGCRGHCGGDHCLDCEGCSSPFPSFFAHDDLPNLAGIAAHFICREESYEKDAVALTLVDLASCHLGGVSRMM